MARSLSSSAMSFRRDAMRLFGKSTMFRTDPESLLAKATHSILAELMDDPDWRIRYLGVAYLGYPKSIEPEVVADLVRALGDSCVEVRFRAARSLLDMVGDQRIGLDALFERLGDTARDDRSGSPVGGFDEPDSVFNPKASIAEVLGAFREIPEQALSWLIKQTTTKEDEDLRCRAIRSLLMHTPGNVKAVEALLAASSEVPQLWKTLCELEPFPEELFPTLLRETKDRSHDDPRPIIECMGNLRKPIPEAVEYLLELACRSTDIHDSSLWALAKLIRSRADLLASAIRRLATSEIVPGKSAVFRMEPILEQMNIADAAVFRVFVDTYDSRDFRRFALDAIAGDFPNKGIARAPWRNLFLEPHAGHHHLAAIALARQGVFDAVIVHNLLLAISSNDEAVVDAADSVLRAKVMKATTGLDLLIGLLEGQPEYAKVPSGEIEPNVVTPQQLGALRRLLVSPVEQVRRFAALALHCLGVDDRGVWPHLPLHVATDISRIVKRGFYAGEAVGPKLNQAIISVRMLNGTATNEDLEEFFRSSLHSFYSNDVLATLLAINGNRDVDAQRIIASHILSGTYGEIVCESLGRLERPTRHVIQSLCDACAAADDIGRWTSTRAKAALAKIFLSDSNSRYEWEAIFLQNAHFRRWIIEGVTAGFAASEDTVQFLLGFTSHPDSNLRADSLAILSKVDDPEGRIALRAIQLWRDSSSVVRHASALVLENMKIKAGADIEVLWTLSEFDRGAGISSDPAGLSTQMAVIALLQDLRSDMREWAVRVIASGVESDPDRIQHLLPKLEDKIEKVRVQAVRGLLFDSGKHLRLAPFFALLRDGRASVYRLALSMFAETKTTQGRCGLEHLNLDPRVNSRQIIQGILWLTDQISGIHNETEYAILDSRDRRSGAICYRWSRDERIGGTPQTALLQDVAPFVVFTLMIQQVPNGTYSFEKSLDLTHGLLSILGKTFGVWHRRPRRMPWGS